MQWIGWTLGDMLDMQAEKYADKDCLVFKDTKVSYGLLRDKAEALAQALLDIGVKREEHVAIWMPNCPEWLYCMFAIAKLGGISIPLNTRFKTYDAQYILKQSDTGTLIIKDRLLKIDFVGMVYELLPKLKIASQLDSENFPCLKRVICLGNENHPGMFGLRQLLEAGEKSKQDIKSIQTLVKPDDVAMIQYTSGTTGFPKGAMLTHGALVRDGACIALRWRASEQDRIFSAFPFYHNGGSVWTMMTAMTSGATVYTQEFWDAADAVRLMEEGKCTIWPLWDTMFNDLVQDATYNQHKLSSLRLIPSAGLPEFRRRVSRELNVEISSVYGLTEASPNVCDGDIIDDPPEKRIETIGKPHDGVELKIINPESGETLPAGKMGEICVRGWLVMKGYYKKPEETAKTIDEQGWLHTGDLGLLDENGYLSFEGRLKDMIKPGGENVSAEEVEDFLYTYPKVKQAAVVGAPDQRMGEVPFAFIELKEGEQCSEQEIIDYCKGKIANFKVPRYVRFVKEWPLTSSAGKIQKFELRKIVDTEFGQTQNKK